MLRVGLLSTARINAEILAGAALSDRVEVVAVASRDPARAEAYAREHGLARAHGSYDALLEDDEVDAIYIPLPNGLHHEWTMRSLQAGKHVLCEKPYSRRPAEVEEAFDVADRAGLAVMEAFMYRHHPQTRVVANLVAGGAVGRVRMLKTAFTFALGNLDDARAKPELDGGSLMDVGCYCVSGARLLLGEPVEATGEQRLGPTGVDMSFRGALRFADGAVSLLRASFEVPRSQELEVVGEEGRLRVATPWRPDFGIDVVLERDGETSRVDVPQANMYQLELENLADAAAGVAPLLLGRADALGQARTIDALYRSAAEGGTAVSL
jgi:D-xylose 1-dehydrogenase (NADP+, D-xylono-1,5-lactone-forming)